MDEKIAAALVKSPGKGQPFLLEYANQVQEIRNAKIPVSTKDMRTYRDGTLFASRGEMLRYDYLLNVQKAGGIKHLKTQVPFVLQESFTSKQKEWGNVQELIYVADFVYTNVNFRKGYEDRECVEDHKGGYVTDVYKIKRKLFLCKFAYYLFFEVGDNERGW